MSIDLPTSDLTRAWRARPLRTAWHLLLPVLAVLLALALVVGAAAAAVVWLLSSEDGTAWLLARLPGVQANGVRGALLSPRWEVERLTIEIGGGLKSVHIENAVAEGLRWSWRPDGQAWVGVQVTRLTARRVLLATGTAKSPGPPASIASPLLAVIEALEIDEFTIGTLAPLRNVKARGTLGALGGTLHRIDALAFDAERVHGEASGEIGTARPFELSARAALRPRDVAPSAQWAAQLVARGALERFAASATLRGTAREGHAAPSLDLAATIASFARWPIASLKGNTDALDLASLSSALPSTRLAGTVEVQSTALEAPVSAEVKLDNQQPGRWDQQRLPLRRIELALRADLGKRDSIDIGSFELQFAGAGGQDAGRWRGSGQWKSQALQLQTRLDALRPQLIDARAIAAQVSGPLKMVLSGLPLPAVTRRTASGTVPDTAPAAEPLRLDLQGELEGRLDAAPVPLRVQLDAAVGTNQLLLRQLRASAGSAVAQLSARAERAAANGWQLKTEGSLVDFDPVLWWPGAEGSAWRQGPHRVSAEWQLDLRLPANALQLAPVQLAQSTAASGVVRLTESMLAGVPLQGELTLGYQPGAAIPGSLHGEFRVGGNSLRLEGRGDPLGAGLQDRYRADLKAGALAGLAPLLRLLPDLAEWAPRDGQLEATLSAEGRWPDMRSEGSASVQQLRVAELALARGQLGWKFDTGAEQAVSGSLDVSQLRWGRQALEQLKLELQGTARQHRLQLDAELPLRPPAWLANLLGLRPGPGTRARLRAEGAWQNDGAGAGSWRGQVDELLVGAGGNTGAPAESGEWLEAKALRAELRFSPAGGLQELRAEAGRARIARELQLRWDEIRVDNRGARPDFDIRAQVEPFQLAPMLARMQPTMGWGGDLRLSARMSVQAAQRFAADVVFERDRGDLHIDDVAGRQPLGLQTLRLAMTAQDGRWALTQALAGRILGDISGEQELRTRPEQRWPDASSALSGRVQARVGNLGIWSAWVPPGWRLGGSITTQATIGGRLGAPEYTGRVEGRGIAVRNLLLGVDVSDGELEVSLQGESAKIERLSLRGGEGRMEISGGAEFGTAPVAQLQAKAQRFRVLGRIDRQLVVSGDAAVELRADRLKVDGSVVVDEGLFDVSRSDAPSLDDDVVIRDPNQPRRERDSDEPPKTARGNPQVAVAVDLGDKLRVRGRGLDTLLGGQLRVSTPAGRLAIHGLVRAQGGTYAAYAQKLEIERGILIFSGVPENPTLDILALRPNIDTKVGVAITGSFIGPRVRLYSDPEMSETDKLSWLVLGRPSDGLGRADTALLQRAAVALLAGEGEAPTDALLRRLGLDEFSLRQSDGEVRETVITLGKQLSRRWYLGYERSVNATSGTWQLIYRIAQRFTLRAQSGQENSLDVIWVWRVGEGEKK